MPRTRLYSLICLVALSCAACADDENDVPSDAGARSDAGHGRDAGGDRRDGGDEPDGDTRSDARVDTGRCSGPLNCAHANSCLDYAPLAHCPRFGPVSEGTCGFGDELRFRVSFNTGILYIEYWELETGKLVATDFGTDANDFCGGTSSRILLGDLKRAEACEASRSELHTYCTGNDDAGADDAG